MSKTIKIDIETAEKILEQLFGKNNKFKAELLTSLDIEVKYGTDFKKTDKEIAKAVVNALTWNISVPKVSQEAPQRKNATHSMPLPRLAWKSLRVCASDRQ